MAIPQQLETDLEALGRQGYQFEIVEEGARVYVIFREFPLPNGKYAPDKTDLMVMADYQYPQSGMDMFWTDPPVTLSNGSYPQNADQFEEYCGRRWQRWSWHYSGWNPSRSSIISHIDVIEDRLRRSG